MQTSIPALLMIAFAAINAIFAINMESDAGHGGVEAELGEYAVHLYRTAAKYHMWHVLGLLSLGILYDLWTDRWSRVSIGIGGLSFALGIVLFSGGMYLVPAGGSLTPVIIGAVIFFIGWGALIAATITRGLAMRA